VVARPLFFAARAGLRLAGDRRRPGPERPRSASNGRGGPRSWRPARRPARGLTLIELLVVVTLIAVLIGLLLPAVQAARETARQTVCSNHLRQIAVALHAHHAAHEHLPEGARLHVRQGAKSIGWHVELLPYLEQAPLYERIAPDADGGARLFAGNVTVPVYLCPSAEPPTADAADLESAHYVGVAGAGTTREDWPLEEVVCGVAATDGTLFLRSRVALEEIADGSSRTLAVGERSIFQVDEDWTLGAVWHRFGKAPRPDSACVAAAKHVVWPLNALERRRVASVRDFAAPAGLPKALSNELPFGSQHPAGGRFARADGSVAAIAEEIDLPTLRALATRAGGEADASADE